MRSSAVEKGSVAETRLSTLGNASVFELILRLKLALAILEENSDSIKRFSMRFVSAKSAFHVMNHSCPRDSSRTSFKNCSGAYGKQYWIGDRLRPVTAANNGAQNEAADRGGEEVQAQGEHVVSGLCKGGFGSKGLSGFLNSLRQLPCREVCKLAQEPFPFQMAFAESRWLLLHASRRFYLLPPFQRCK